MKTFSEFNSALERWFEKTARELPWRETNDPYKIWVSEIMRHQTQIELVAKDFYPQFIAKFPDVKALAAAEWEDIHAVWSGLGFYDRARDMSRAAKIVTEEFGGKLPRDFTTLKTLPGIGSHTAAAILSLSQDSKMAVIDSNVSKILRSLWPDKPVFDSAKSLINSSSSGRMWNLAIADLADYLKKGEKIEGELGDLLPENIFVAAVSKRKKTSPKNKQRVVAVGVACIYKDGKYLIQSRPPGKSFPGSWEFPGGKKKEGEGFRDCVKREIKEELGIEISVEPFFHEIVCNFQSTQLRLRFHLAEIMNDEVPYPLEKQALQWAPTSDFDNIDFLKTNAGALVELKKMNNK